MTDLLELALVFFRLGLISFGGGVAILAEMEREVVTEHGWLTQREFVDGFALGRLTPGPGMLMVMFTGYRVAGIPGAITTLVAIFAPTALINGLVAGHWPRWRTSPWVLTIQRALSPIALGLSAAGGFTILRSAVDDAVGLVVALVSLAILIKWRPNPTWVILGSGLVTTVIYSHWGR